MIGDMLRILDQHRGDLFSPQAIEDYFREVYWRKSGIGLDKHEVMNQFNIGAGGTDFAYRSVAECFRLIADNMVPVIIAVDAKPQRILDKLRNGMPPSAAARQLQSYIVQVQLRDRIKLVQNGHVRFVEGFEDQFAVLQTANLYTRETGLIWERADSPDFDADI